MIFGLFGPSFADRAFDLYAAIVTEARRPVFYAVHGVPDTVAARFDMIVLIMSVVLRRLEVEPKPAPGARLLRGARAVDPHEIGRQVIDVFFNEMDRALREMGVGDPAVPKRIKKLAAAWNGRFLAYAGALVAADRDALVAAIARNVYAGLDDRTGAGVLADHLLASEAALAAVPIADVLAGRIPWPTPPSAPEIAP